MAEKKVRYGMLIDLESCIGCHACTVSCKMENEVPDKCFNTWVEEWDEGDYPNVSRVKLPKMCNHCIDAPCVEVCPVDATFQIKGGIVVVDDEKCIGCGACVTACPYDARYMNKETNKAGKCTFCIQRAEAGLVPSCVSTCVSHARYFGDIYDEESEISKKIAKSDAKGLKEELGLDLAVTYIGLDKVLKNGEEPEERYRGGK